MDVLSIPTRIIDVTSFDIDYILLNLSISSAPLHVKVDVRLLELYEREFRILLL